MQREPGPPGDPPRATAQGDADPDLQFLTVDELDAVIRAIPDEVVHPPAGTDAARPAWARAAAAARRPRTGASRLILAAAMTGLRQSELLGLRWRDVDWVAQRIRVRNTFVRGEHSSDGKSDLSTRRSVPMADRLPASLTVVAPHRVPQRSRPRLRPPADG